LSPVWAWRLGFTLLGVVSYGASASLLARELARIVAPEEGRWRRMTWIFYFAGGLTACLAGVRNPLGWKLVLISAAASSLGGASALLWIPSIAACGMAKRVASAAPLRKMPVVYVAAALLLVAYVWLLGPGVTLNLIGKG
jgi:hypothetical protein